MDWSDKETRPPLPRTSGIAGNQVHWTDRLENGVKAHIQAMQQQRDEPASKARPPQAVPDVALADPEVVRLGAGLNKAYAAALRMGKLALSKAEGGQKTVPADYLNVFQHSLTNLFGCDLQRQLIHIPQYRFSIL